MAILDMFRPVYHPQDGPCETDMREQEAQGWRRCGRCSRIARLAGFARSGLPHSRPRSCLSGP